MKKVIFILLSLLFVLCSEKSPVDPIPVTYPYEKPIILSPKDSSTYYNSEQIVIEWKLPEGITNSEIQEIWIPEFYNDNYKIVFDTTSFINGYGNQTKHIFSYQNPELFDGIKYMAYRIRAIGPNGESDWTDINSICIKPINELIIKKVKLNLNIDFIAEEMNKNYSGLVSNLTFNYDSLLSVYNFYKDSIKVIRPISGKLFYNDEPSNIDKIFERYVLGIGELSSDSLVYHPFDVLADIYFISPNTGEGKLTIYPYGGIYRNLKYLFESNNLFHFTYFLEDTNYVASKFSFTVELDLDFYLNE